MLSRSELRWYLTSSKPVSGTETMPSYEKPTSTAVIISSNIQAVWCTIVLFASTEESGGPDNAREGFQHSRVLRMVCRIGALVHQTQVPFHSVRWFTEMHHHGAE